MNPTRVPINPMRAGGISFALAISNSSCLCNISLCWVVNANAVSGGIWAQDIISEFAETTK